MTNRENKHRVVRFLVAVQGHIPGPTAGNHKLSQAILRGPADEGMIGKDMHGFRNEVHHGRGSYGIGLQQEVREALKISKSLPRID